MRKLSKVQINGSEININTFGANSFALEYEKNVIIIGNDGELLDKKS